MRWVEGREEWCRALILLRSQPWPSAFADNLTQQNASATGERDSSSTRAKLAALEAVEPHQKRPMTEDGRLDSNAHCSLQVPSLSHFVACDFWCVRKATVCDEKWERGGEGWEAVKEIPPKLKGKRKKEKKRKIKEAALKSHHPIGL